MSAGTRREDYEDVAVLLEPTELPDRDGRPGPATRWSRATAALLLLAALAVAWVSWAAFAQASLPWDNTRIGAALYPQSEWSDGVVLHTVLDPTSPLKDGDRVVEIDGVPLSDWVSDHRGEQFDVDDRLSYGVIRDGRPQTFEVTLTTYDWGAVLQYCAASLIVEFVLIVVAVGVVVARPRDPAARVLFAIAAAVPFGFPDWPFRGAVLGLTLSPWPLWPQLAAGCVWAIVWGAMIPHFALVFPKPPAILARRRWIVPGLYAAPLLVYAAYLAATLPSAANQLEQAERLSSVWLVSQRYAPIAIIVLITWAYLRSRGTDDRPRVALVVVSLLIAFGVNLVGVQLPHLIIGESVIPRQFSSLVFLVVPFAIALAILRHQLFDIRVVLRRSLLAAGLAGAVGGIYVLCLILLGHPTRAELPYFLTGTAAALVLPPLHRWLRGAVTHRIYGARDDPYGLVERIVSLEPGDDPQLMLQRLARTLCEALHLPYVEISLNQPGQVIRASHGTSEEPLHRVALVRATEVVGFVDLDVGHGREPFGPADQRLLTAIATHAAATISATILNLNLQESRARLVSSREEERRRIRNDLHDGVGPKLALLSMNLEVIKELISQDPASAERLVDAAHARAQEAGSEVRRVVSDLRPAILDELGLEKALGILIDQIIEAHRHDKDGPFDVILETKPANELGQLPAAVEVAAYRIISEALNNASRHAHATKCWVRIRFEDPLRICVHDNGQGILVDSTSGTGLTSISERACELGGTASVQPARDGGTVVTATIPLHPTE